MRTASAVLFLSVCSAILTIFPGAVANAAADAPAVAQYHCPMHPSYVDDRKGDCPVCGMKLVPVKSAAKAAAPQPAARALAIAADKQKVLGIVVPPALRSPGARTVRALGRVAPDEARVYRINAGAAGSIREVSPVVTGSRVKKDQILGSFYAPDTISGTQLFVLNTQGFARKKVQTVTEQPQGEKGEDDSDVGKNNSSLYKANVQQRVIQLENFGISAIQREQIMREGRVPDAVWIVAPADGVVLARNISLAQKFDRGFEFYRIADLRKIWVLADVFPQDARHVRAGMRAEISVPEQRIALAATVTEILPQFDAATRTLKVKLTVDNRGFVLRPDMFVDVALKAELPAGVLVPSDAIVDSGLVKRVFVQSAEGVFEPRVIETGWRSGDRVEVVKGLRLGELVVSSGTFFLDSETRMRPPPSGAAAADAPRPVPTGHRPGGGAGTSMEARAENAR
ncbi:MAG: efflux RND transporter periplasmic adaptor subunit [Anaeromyxobacteraceae bacterium]